MADKRPVVIDARMPAYTGAGIARYVQGLLSGLAEVGVPNVAALIARREQGSWWQTLAQRGIRIRRAATPCHHPLERWAFPLEASRLHPALLHLVDHVGPGIRPCPTIVTVHDLAFWRYPWTHSPASRRYYAAAAVTLPAANAIICVSGSVRDELLRTLPLRPERVFVVHNGLDARFRPRRDQAAVERQFGVSHPYILAVGTIEERKNLTALIDALYQLERPDIHLALVGADGWGSDAVWRAAEERGMLDRIHRLGRVSDDDLPLLYSSAAILAFPSRYEGFAFPPLEAMACGTPVVAAHTSSLPEVCGDAAELTAPSAEGIAAGLAHLLDDASRREELIRRGRQQARHFSWQRCARETLAVYQGVLDRA